jgi:hypothetical protein
MEGSTVIDAATIAVTGGIALGAARVLGRFALRGLKRDLTEVVTGVVTELVEPIRLRTEQLVPNGGSSLRDAIDRIEHRLAEVEAVVEPHSEELQEPQE